MSRQTPPTPVAKPPTSLEIIGELEEYLEALVEDVIDLTPDLGCFAKTYVYTLAFTYTAEWLRLHMGKTPVDKLYQKVASGCRSSDC